MSNLIVIFSLVCSLLTHIYPPILHTPSPALPTWVPKYCQSPLKACSHSQLVCPCLRPFTANMSPCDVLKEAQRGTYLEHSKCNREAGGSVLLVTTAFIGQSPISFEACVVCSRRAEKSPARSITPSLSALRVCCKHINWFIPYFAALRWRRNDVNEPCWALIEH